jgi:hypothetical protein
MSDWTTVISRNAQKRQNAQDRAWEQQRAVLDSVKDTEIEWDSIIDPKTGVPKQIAMEWPSVSKNAESPLLSEQFGLTDPVAILVADWYIQTYEKIGAFLSKYPVPIYHIHYEEHTDMGYDHKGRRAPYTESIDVHVWTYGAKNVPVVHVYRIDLDQYSKKSSASFRYRYSYSPVKCCGDEYYENIEEAVRMITLSA